MNTKHTPGPWFASASPLHQLEVTERSGLVVALAYPRPAYPRANQEELANAQLIAAAPELLEALQAIQELTEKYSNAPFAADCVRIAQTAIARATSHSPV